MSTPGNQEGSPQQEKGPENLQNRVRRAFNEAKNRSEQASGVIKFAGRLTFRKKDRGLQQEIDEALNETDQSTPQLSPEQQREANLKRFLEEDEADLVQPLGSSDKTQQLAQTQELNTNELDEGENPKQDPDEEEIGEDTLDQEELTDQSKNSFREQLKGIPNLDGELQASGLAELKWASTEAEAEEIINRYRNMSAYQRPTEQNKANDTNILPDGFVRKTVKIGPDQQDEAGGPLPEQAAAQAREGAADEDKQPETTINEGQQDEGERKQTDIEISEPVRKQITEITEFLNSGMAENTDYMKIATRPEDGVKILIKDPNLAVDKDELEKIFRSKGIDANVTVGKGKVLISFLNQEDQLLESLKEIDETPAIDGSDKPKDLEQQLKVIQDEEIRNQVRTTYDVMQLPMDQSGMRSGGGIKIAAPEGWDSTTITIENRGNKDPRAYKEALNLLGFEDVDVNPTDDGNGINIYIPTPLESTLNKLTGKTETEPKQPDNQEEATQPPVTGEVRDLPIEAETGPVPGETLVPPTGDEEETTEPGPTAAPTEPVEPSAPVPQPAEAKPTSTIEIDTVQTEPGEPIITDEEAERRRDSAAKLANSEFSSINKIIRSRDGKLKPEYLAQRITSKMESIRDIPNIGEQALALFERQLKDSEFLQDQGNRVELREMLGRMYNNRGEQATSVYYQVLLSENPEQDLQILNAYLNQEDKDKLLEILERKNTLGANLEEVYDAAQTILRGEELHTETDTFDETGREEARRTVQEGLTRRTPEIQHLYSKEITTDTEYKDAIRLARSVNTSERKKGENYLRYFVGPTTFRKEAQRKANERVQGLTREVANKDNIQDLSAAELAQVRSKLILELREGIDPTDEQKDQKLELIVQGIDNALAQPKSEEIDRAREVALQALQRAEGLNLDAAAKQEAINAALIENGLDNLVQNRELSLTELNRFLDKRRNRQFTKVINDAITSANENQQRPGMTGDEIESARKKAMERLKELGYNMDDNALITQFSNTFTDLTQPDTRTSEMRQAINDIQGSGAQRVGAIKERLINELGFHESEVNDLLMAEHKDEFEKATTRRDIFGDLAVESIRENRARQEKVKQLKKQLDREYTRAESWSRKFENMKLRFERWGLKLRNGLKFGLLFGGIGFLGPAAFTGVGASALAGAGILGLPSLLVAFKYSNERMRNLQDEIEQKAKENQHYVGYLKNKDNFVKFFEGIRTYQDTGDLSKTSMGDIVMARALGLNLERKLEASEMLRQVNEHVTYLDDIQKEVRRYLNGGTSRTGNVAVTGRGYDNANIRPTVNFSNA